MKTLVVYDNTGKIYYQASGDYTKPQGLQYIEVEIPKGKYIAGVDPKTHTAILEEIPPTKTEQMQKEIDDLQLALAEVVGGVQNG